MKQRVLIRLLILVLVAVLSCGMLTVAAAAAEQTDGQTTESVASAEQSGHPDNEQLGGLFSRTRIEYAVKVTLQGMLMIFAVLVLLWGAIAVMKVFLHDIPQKRAAGKAAMAAAVSKTAEPEPAAQAMPVAEQDEGETVAVITAAIAAMLQSEEYAGEFASGFRVVSFKRKGGAWDQNN